MGRPARPRGAARCYLPPRRRRPPARPAAASCRSLPRTQASAQSLDGKPFPTSFVCPVSMEIMVRRCSVMGAARAAAVAGSIRRAHAGAAAVLPACSLTVASRAALPDPTLPSSRTP